MTSITYHQTDNSFDWGNIILGNGGFFSIFKCFHTCTFDVCDAWHLFKILLTELHSIYKICINHMLQTTAYTEEKCF